MMATGKKKKKSHEVNTSDNNKEDECMEELKSEEDDENVMDDTMEDDDEGKTEVAEEKVYLPGQTMGDDEELTFDKSAYQMYHAAQTGAPCLSFDIIPDELGDNRTEFPMTSYMVCGTQMDGKPNHLIVMKMVDLVKITEDESDSEDSYIEDEEDGPKLKTVSLTHVGGVNRVRYAQVANKKLAASWSETGNVFLWDFTKQLESLDLPGVPQHQTAADGVKPIFSFSGHQAEGFALDWSPTIPGRLATGSCNKNIHLWQARDDGSWHVDQRPLNAHTDSVEDIQWSPNESNVFSSCSVDQTIRIWDARAVGNKACMLTVQAHDADVNVISWNGNDPFILSGGDDGIIKVWDLRQFQSGCPVATFKHHSAYVTSVEWHPTDATVFAASGADNQVTIWDLAVEKDDENEEMSMDANQLPPQLLFIHMGQTDVKEIHWHRQLPGVLASTAVSGFNIFKTISV